MKTIRSLTLGIIILTCAVLSWGINPAGKNAKASFPQALSTAKSWQKDVVLIQISSGDVNEDGTSAEWTYSFYSPKAKKWFTVTASGEKVDGLEVGFGKTDSVDESYIDSDKAMKEAKANGLKGETPGMSLSFYDFGQKAGSFWMVTGGYEPGDVTIFLEAKTGELFTRRVVE